MILAGTGEDQPYSVGAATNVTDAFVQVGARSLSVADPSRFKVGGMVQIRHPSTRAWIAANDGGGMVKEPDWSPGSRDMYIQRKVVRIEGSKLHLDAPIYNHLDRKLSQSVVAPITGRKMIAEVGVESLRVHIQVTSRGDENHAEHGLVMFGVEDSWVRNVTAVNFLGSGILVGGAQRVTATDVEALDPAGSRVPGNFYPLGADKFSELVLFKDCVARDGRHNLITNGSVNINGIVFHNCRSISPGNDDASEAHRQWNTGILYDSITSTGGAIRLFNRGDAGTQHGWAAAHSTIWNSNGKMMAQKPPTAQNYAISDAGSFETSYRNPGRTGYLEKKAGTLFPRSLYKAQLCERLRNAD